MKLVTVSCTAMLAIAPATVGFAQYYSLQDRGSAAKTTCPCSENTAASTSQMNSPGLRSGRSVSANERGPETTPSAAIPNAPTRNADQGGDRFYPDWGSVAKTTNSAQENVAKPSSEKDIAPAPITGRSSSAAEHPGLFDKAARILQSITGPIKGRSSNTEEAASENNPSAAIENNPRAAMRNAESGGTKFYPDFGSIAKTGGAPPEGGAPGIITGRSSSSKEGASETNPISSSAATPNAQTQSGGDRFYPDWGSIAKTVSPASESGAR